ncbi:perforin-1-like [Esox lucius]|uniref:perforin-1-like n=1 Tax=Esox lucius TaxID=8010 RepID=UPI0014769886|nr:perforin-1-like [Esox lucius]
MCQGYDVVKMRLKQVYVIDSQSYLTTATGSCTLCENPLTSSRFEKLPIAVQDWLVNSNCRLGLFSSSLSPVSSLVGSVSSVIQNDWRTAVGLAGSTSLQLEGSRSAVSDFASARARVDKSLFTLQQLHYSQYSYRLFSSPPLHSVSQREAFSLPTSLNTSTLPMYHRFIAIYGTHYIYQEEV